MFFAFAGYLVNQQLCLSVLLLFCFVLYALLGELMKKKEVLFQSSSAGIIFTAVTEILNRRERRSPTGSQHVNIRKYDGFK